MFCVARRDKKQERFPVRAGNRSFFIHAGFVATIAATFAKPVDATQNQSELDVELFHFVRFELGARRPFAIRRSRQI
jgi:hypothetical protein